MSDATSPLYIEAECEVCGVRYNRYLRDIELVLPADSANVFITSCSQCGTERVIIIGSQPETLSGQVAELRYPLIDLEDIRHLGRDAFIRAVIERVADYVNLPEEASHTKVRLKNSLTQEKIDQGQVAERERISRLGKLPGGLYVADFLENNPFLEGRIGSTPWKEK